MSVDANYLEDIIYNSMISTITCNNVVMRVDEDGDEFECFIQSQTNNIAINEDGTTRTDDANLYIKMSEYRQLIIPSSDRIQIYHNGAWKENRIIDRKTKGNAIMVLVIGNVYTHRSS